MLPAGVEAQRVFNDAQLLLNRMIESGSLKGRGLLGFWHAQSDGDDINVYKDDVTVHRDTKPLATFYGLRQQVWVISSCSAFIPCLILCHTQLQTVTL